MHARERPYCSSLLGGYLACINERPVHGKYGPGLACIKYLIQCPHWGLSACKYGRYCPVLHERPHTTHKQHARPYMGMPAKIMAIGMGNIKRYQAMVSMPARELNELAMQYARLLESD